MKMKYNYIIAALVFSMLTFNCSKDESNGEEEVCMSIVLEDQLLKDDIDLFKIYDGVEKVIFVNNNDQEYEFEIVDRIDTLVYQENESFCEGDIILETFQRQERKMGLKGPEDIYIAFSHKVDYWKYENNFEETRLIDELEIIQSKNIDTIGIITSSQIKFLTSDRGGVVDIDSLNRREYNWTEFLLDHTILEKNFVDLYGNIDMEMYFSKEFGVVSFSFYENKNVVFDRFEY